MPKGVYVRSDATLKQLKELQMMMCVSCHRRYDIELNNRPKPPVKLRKNHNVTSV